MKYILKTVLKGIVSILFVTVVIFHLFYPPALGRGRVKARDLETCLLYVNNDSCEEWWDYRLIADEQLCKEILELCLLARGRRAVDPSDLMLGTEKEPFVYLVGEQVRYCIVVIKAQLQEKNPKVYVSMDKRTEEGYQNVWSWVSTMEQEPYVRLYECLSNYHEGEIVQLG